MTDPLDLDYKNMSCQLFEVQVWTTDSSNTGEAAEGHADPSVRVF